LVMSVAIPDSTEKIKKLIATLKYLLKYDTSEKDRKYHKMALAQLEAKLSK